MPHSKPTIHLATDHAGFEYKEQLLSWLQREGYTVVDHGAVSYDPLDDFTDFVLPAAQAVGSDVEQSVGIILGGSGQGEAMVANRVSGVRATVYYGCNEEIITLSRTHNNANILSIGARFVSIDEAKKVIWDWLHTPFSGAEKYQRRNQKIDELTKNSV